MNIRSIANPEDNKRRLELAAKLNGELANKQTAEARLRLAAEALVASESRLESFRPAYQEARGRLLNAEAPDDLQKLANELNELLASIDAETKRLHAIKSEQGTATSELSKVNERIHETRRALGNLMPDLNKPRRPEDDPDEASA